MNRPSPFKPIRVTLATPGGCEFQLNVWRQGGELRVSLDGLLNAAAILEPQSVRKACLQILQMLDE